MIFLTLTHLFKLKPPGLLLKRKRSMAKSWQITWQNKDPNEAVKSPLIIGIRLSYYRAAMASLLLKKKKSLLLHTSILFVLCHTLQKSVNIILCKAPFM